MALPKVQSNFYSVELPIAKRKVKYRPFLVAERNRLLVAKQLDSEEAIAEAISEIVRLVTDGAVDTSRDSFVDAVYVFMLSRARAVAETSNIFFACGCSEEGKVSATVKVSDINVEVPEVEKDISLGQGPGGSELRITLKTMSFDAFIAAKNDLKGDIILLKSSIERMYDDDTVYDMSQATDEEWEDWYVNLPSNAYDAIKGFLKNPPKAKLKATGKCDKCGKQITRTLEGLRNFS